MDVKPFFEGLQDAYFDFIKQHPEVKQALYKEAAGEEEEGFSVGPLGAAGIGVGSFGLGIGAKHLYDKYQQRKQEEEARKQQEAAAAQQLMMQQQYAYPGYDQSVYYGYGY